MSDERIRHLAYELFQLDPRGQEFLALLRDDHSRQKTFPMPEEVMTQYGGALGWAAYREGQLGLLRLIEHLAQDYADRVQAANQQATT